MKLWRKILRKNQSRFWFICFAHANIINLETIDDVSIQIDIRILERLNGECHVGCLLESQVVKAMSWGCFFLSISFAFNRSHSPWYTHNHSNVDFFLIFMRRTECVCVIDQFSILFGWLIQRAKHPTREKKNSQTGWCDSS